MTKARVIGWSDEGYPIYDPESLSSVGDAVDDSYGSEWEEFAEQVFGTPQPPTGGHVEQPEVDSAGETAAKPHRARAED